jgi:branched-chain amino acid transport system substrate-binding protein
MIPEKIGIYIIKGELGRGGMATVFHGYDPRFEREVAIKMLPHELLHDPSFRARFEREAKTIAALEHPAIVPVHDFGEHEGQPYLVMRYMAGGSLEDRIKQGRLSLTEASRVVSRLAPALDEAHERGIIHRDLKPGNILFDQRGDPYLSDFGIVKLTESATTLTAGGIIGTPAYMSPEQGRGDEVDGRSDIYSMGAILFQMLTAVLPYHATTPHGMIIKHITDPVPDIRAVRADLAAEVQAIIARAMAKDREQRYPTMIALARDLEALASGAVVTAARPAAVPPPPTTEIAAPGGVSTLIDTSTPVGPAPTPPAPPRPPAAPVVLAKPTPAPAQPPVQVVAPRPVKAPKKGPNWLLWGGLAGLLLLALCIGGGVLGASLIFKPQPTTVVQSPTKRPPTPVPATAIPATAPTNEKLRVAVLAPLSGVVPEFGASMRNGVQMAVDEWNAQGGVLGRIIEPVFFDSQCSADPALQAAKQVADQGFHYILGEVCSSASIPISEIAEANGIVQISPTATDPDVTLNPDGSLKTYVFRAAFIDTFQGQVMASFALQQGYRTAFVMYDQGNPYSLGLAEYFEAAFVEAGGTLVGKETYVGSDTDFSAILAEVAKSKAEVLFLPDYYHIANQVGAQAKEKGLSVVLLGGDGWDSSALDLAALEGGFFSTHFDPFATQPAVQDWVARYQAKYQASADAIAALSYDAANLLLTAIAQAGVDDPQVVKDVLAGISFPAVSGDITFDGAHNPIKSAPIIGIQQGEKYSVTTIYPGQPVAAPTAAPTPAPVAKFKVGLVTDVGGVNDKSFNQSAWAGVQMAAEKFGWEARYIESKQQTDYEKNIDQFATEGYDVIITVGFMMGDATAIKAKQYPDIKFAIIDSAYFPTSGSSYCDDTVKDCYTDGGLSNVTSLMFKEDEVGFLAGVLAAGMTRSGTICSVAGMEIPPVQRFVIGYQSGAAWLNPQVQALNVYIPSFTDPALGKETGLSMISQGCDVVFGVGGNTGNGGLLAAFESGLMAIGVDVDQYYTYPEVAPALISSAMKNVDSAVFNYLLALYTGQPQSGVVTATLANGGVGLAPFHDWEGQVPQSLIDKIKEAVDGLVSGLISTGY